MRPVAHKIHKQRHKLMIEFQKKIKPFVPTVRELQNLWGLRTTSATWRTLEYLVNVGLAITRTAEGDGRVKYFAVNKKHE